MATDRFVEDAANASNDPTRQEDDKRDLWVLIAQRAKSVRMLRFGDAFPAEERSPRSAPPESSKAKKN
jgi:hypothetical protein